ncbi:hypothetical protein UPYG_G00297020 [Umbra pygmaea]|uniref:Uncharacterized protein n=1 Tax=Umbra pygmaea TaxID=75934 RepID=A0ABD0WSD4_UMBPY
MEWDSKDLMAKIAEGLPTTIWVHPSGARGRAALGVQTRALVLTGATPSSRTMDRLTSMKGARSSTGMEKRTGGEDLGKNTREATEVEGQVEEGAMGGTGALRRKDFPMMEEISEAAGMIGIGGEDRVALEGGASLTSLAGRRRTLIPQTRWAEAGTMEEGGDRPEEVAHPGEEVTRVIERDSALTTAHHTTARPLPAASAPLHCRVWTWPRYLHGNARGTTVRALETPRDPGKRTGQQADPPRERKVEAMGPHPVAAEAVGEGGHVGHPGEQGVVGRTGGRTQYQPVPFCPCPLFPEIPAPPSQRGNKDGQQTRLGPKKRHTFTRPLAPSPDQRAQTTQIQVFGKLNDGFLFYCQASVEKDTFSSEITSLSLGDVRVTL